MSVALLGEDRNVHVRMGAVSPSEDVSTGTWKLGDTLPVGDDIASTVLAVGPGFTGSLDLTLVRPDGSTGDSSVKLFRRYQDRDGNVLASFVSSALAVDSTPATHTLALSTAPAGTAACEVGLLSNTTPPGDPVRTNEFPDPRCTSTAIWEARNSWTLGAGTGATGLPAGVTSYVYAQCVSAGSASNSGLNLYGAVGSASPPATGAPAVPGATMTFSVYVYSAKAGTVTLEARPFAGTAWSAIAAVSTASVSAATWTRVSVTLTVPAGATQLAATVRMSTITWAAGDQFRVSAILIEEAATALGYFDGTSNGSGLTPPVSSKWESAANASRSLLYAATTPGGTTVQATDSVLTYSAEALMLLGSALERDLRRSVADVFNSEQALITAGTPAMLSGQLTFLCASLAQALALDAVYRMSGLVTLDSDDELSGLTHRAVGRARINPERALPGKPAKWLLTVEFREQAR